MVHPNNPSIPDGRQRDQDGEISWSSELTQGNDHSRVPSAGSFDDSFDRHPFGRMDRPFIPPTFGNISVSTNSLASPQLHEPVAASSISNDSLVFDHVFASPRCDGSRERHDETTAKIHEESYEMDDFDTPSKPHGLYRDILPSDITPYLGLRARLAQVPINRWTILLILVLARLIILFESLNTNLTSAQDEAASACLKVEEIGSAMASMPHYLSAGVNELVAMGITNTVHGLIKVLIMILTGLLEMLMFMIERTYGTIVCIAASFIKGLIALAAAAVEGLLQGIDTALQIAVSGLSDAVDDFAKGLDSAIQFANGIIGLNIPSLSGVESAVDGLKTANFINATTTLDSITDFDNKIPNFDEIISDLQAVVGLPFTTVETLLNESFGNWTMDPSVLPTASKEQLTFCTGNDTITEFFDVLFIIARSARIIAICGMILAALLAAAFMTWFEYQRYQRTVAESVVLLDREPMDAVYINVRPLTARTGLWISQKVSSDPTRKMLIRWVVAYATTYPALLVLSLAVAGGLSVLCQFFIIGAVQKEAPGLAQEVGTFVKNATDAMKGSSAQWANESNQAMSNLEHDMNEKILVHVRDATGAVVNLINAFENETTTVLRDFFGNNPIGVAADNFTEGLLDCVIFRTLDKVKSGITWINEEAHVTLPEFPFDVFSLGATGSSDNSSFSTLLTNSAAQTAKAITTAMDKVVVTLQRSMVQDALIAIALFVVYIAPFGGAAFEKLRFTFCSRLPRDAKKGGYAVEDPRASQDSMRDKGMLPGSTRSSSMAPSSRLPNLDWS